MYPIKFKKYFVNKIWGGQAFKNILGINLPKNQLIGESWEVSSHKNGMSIVENGPFKGLTLKYLVEKYKDKLLGNEIITKFNGNFPILIKYLDINDRLSIQVHPNDEYALKMEGEYGKSESWYIIDATPHSKLILGLNENITKESFLEKTKNKDFSEMFNEIEVKRGDFINITPGIVHASLKGNILLCETQQNSDTTYRIYDFDRIVNGKTRPLHLKKASDVISFGQVPTVTEERTRQNIKLRNAVKQELLRGKYFNIDKLKINGFFYDEINENFKIYSIIDGKGEIFHNGIEYNVKKGDTFFIPANLAVIINGNIELLKSFI